MSPTNAVEFRDKESKTSWIEDLRAKVKPNVEDCNNAF